jgi:NAD(P)-dependent dehydrogenase (short-subunit alcohol dehydrogenase family)
MMTRFTDKVALITGGSSGLGAATAMLMAAEGAKVVIAARRRDKGEAVLAKITAAGGEGLFVQTDVTRSEDVEAMVAQTLSRYGRLDLAVNNSGITGRTMTLLADVKEDDFSAVIDTNLTAVWRCMKHEIPAMLAGGGGAIVNVASVYGYLASDLSHAGYCASKHGVIGLTKTAAVDYGDKGVRVNAICPGFTHSEMVDPVVAAAPDLMKTVVKRHSAMNRLGESAEIAEAIAWLCSDAASFINGAELAADGGPTTRIY